MQRMKSLIAVCLFLGLGCCFVPNLAAQTNSQWGQLQPGQYRVGFRVVQQYDYSRTLKPKTDFAGTPTTSETAAPMQIGIWYPAKATASAAKMRYEDYLYLNQKSETFGAITPADKDKARDTLRNQFRFAFSREIAEPEMQAILSASTAAMRDAEPERGPFPVILGGFGYVGSASVLAEYLASQGYVVAATTRHTQIATLQVNKPQVALEWHTRSFEYLLAFLREFRSADLNRMGLLGINYDGMAAVNFQMRNLNADAVVSLDGWEGKLSSSANVRQSPYFDVYKLRVPYLLFLHDKPPNPGLRFDAAFFNALKYSERYAYQVSDVEHFEYIANPLALPMLAAEKRAGVEFVYQTVLHFLNAYVKKEASSIAFLKRSAEANGFAKTLLKLENKQTALKPVPTVEEFEQLLGVGLGQDGSGVKRGIEVFRAAKKENPDVELFSVQAINLFAFRMKQQNKKETAIELLKLGVEAYPQSVAAMNNLGNTYQEFGQKESALECFEKAIVLIAADPTIGENEKAPSRNNIQQKIDALKKT